MQMVLEAGSRKLSSPSRTGQSRKPTPREKVLILSAPSSVDLERLLRHKPFCFCWALVAGTTGLEPATSAVTGAAL